MDLDIGLGPHGPQFLEVEIQENEMIMEEVLENAAGIGVDETLLRMLD